MAKNLRAACLSVNLPMELAQAVYQQVREGKFTSDDEVVRAALRQFLHVGDESTAAAPPQTDERTPRRPRRGGG